MAHLHSVYDTDAHFKINAITRAITNDSSGKTVLIQGDHNSERFTFEVPRLVDGHDLSLCNGTQIHYINIDSANKSDTSKDVYEINDLQISPDSEDVVILSWLISGNATKYAGSLNFLVKFRCLDDAGKVVYVWNTAVFTGISVSSGIDNGEVVAEEYSDILAEWEQRIKDFEASGGASDEQVANAVAQYLKDNPIDTGVNFETDHTLILKDGILSVNTTDQMEQDNTLPMTSAGVYATVGNIEALLKTI